MSEQAIPTPTLTVKDVREWMDYIKGKGEEVDPDLVGSAMLDNLTLHELSWFHPAIEFGLDDIELGELQAIDTAFAKENPEFIRLRSRIIKAGEQVMAA